MTAEASQLAEFRRTLHTHADSYAIELKQNDITRLSDYYELLLTWNPRLHLVAPCSPAQFATRHVLESLLLLPYLKLNSRVADIGSGAGLPIIPVLITRADLQAVLVESSPKKSVFLSEALRITATSQQGRVITARFETSPTAAVDYVTCRALDRFSEMFSRLVQWSPKKSKLLLFGGEELQNQIKLAGLQFVALKIPQSERRWLFVIESEPPAVAGG